LMNEMGVGIAIGGPFRMPDMKNGMMH